MAGQTTTLRHVLSLQKPLIPSITTARSNLVHGMMQSTLQVAKSHLGLHPGVIPPPKVLNCGQVDLRHRPQRAQVTHRVTRHRAQRLPRAERGGRHREFKCQVERQEARESARRHGPGAPLAAETAREHLQDRLDSIRVHLDGRGDGSVLLRRQPWRVEGSHHPVVQARRRCAHDGPCAVVALCAGHVSPLPPRHCWGGEMVRINDWDVVQLDEERGWVRHHRCSNVGMLASPPPPPNYSIVLPDNTAPFVTASGFLARDWFNGGAPFGADLDNIVILNAAGFDDFDLSGF